MYIGRQLAQDIWWNKSMQRSTLNCKSSINRIKSNLPICIHLCIYLQIYFYFAWKVLWNIFIYPPERGKGRLPSRPARPQPHKKTHTHTHPPGFGGVGPAGPLRPLRPVVPPTIPLVSNTRWQPTVCSGQRGTINDARKRFYARAGFLYLCVSSSVVFFSLSIHWLAQHVGSH